VVVVAAAANRYATISNTVTAADYEYTLVV
jgi:hypothetical protein